MTESEQKEFLENLLKFCENHLTLNVRNRWPALIYYNYAKFSWETQVDFLLLLFLLHFAVLG